MLLYKPFSNVCKMRSVFRLPADILHALCVITAITHAPPRLMRLIHFVNMFARLVLICVGISLVLSNGSPCTPGLVMAPYKQSEWHNLTLEAWKQNKLPGMDMVVHPKNSILVTLWFVIVIHLFVADTMRCILVVNGTWFTRENHADMIWSGVSCVIIPLLFILIAVQLGTFDVVTLILLAIIACMSGMCGAILEHLRTLVNPKAIPEMSNTVLWMLRVIQDFAMIVASQVVFTPMLLDILHHDLGQSDLVHSIISTLFTAFVYALAITNYRHNRLCSIFEETWQTRFSMVPWGLYTGSNDDKDRSGKAHEPSVTSFPGMYTSTMSHFGRTPKKEAVDVHDPFDPQKSEDLFNSLYGCHLYERSPSADTVHIVDQDHNVVTIKLTEDFNMYGQLCCTGKIARNGVLANGSHLAQIGAAPQLFHHHIDQDGSITRKMIGVLTEWRRYYAVNALIDALLLASLVNITGVMGMCAV